MRIQHNFSLQSGRETWLLELTETWFSMRLHASMYLQVPTQALLLKWQNSSLSWIFYSSKVVFTFQKMKTNTGMWSFKVLWHPFPTFAYRAHSFCFFGIRCLQEIHTSLIKFIQERKAEVRPRAFSPTLSLSINTSLIWISITNEQKKVTSRNEAILFKSIRKHLQEIVCSRHFLLLALLRNFWRLFKQDSLWNKSTNMLLFRFILIYLSVNDYPFLVRKLRDIISNLILWFQLADIS